MTRKIRQLIKTDGTVIDLPARAHTMRELQHLIGAETVDSVNLKDRVNIMIVDDTGLIDGKPRNEKATAIYWERCGGPVPNFIAGDVVIVPDSDFA